MRMIPTLEPIRATETPHSFGFRAFTFLVSEGLSASSLRNLETMELAYSASIMAVTSKDLQDSTREMFQGIRMDLAKTINRWRELDKLEATAPIVSVPPVSAPTAGGKPVAIRKPKPIVPSPSVAISDPF